MGVVALLPLLTNANDAKKITENFIYFEFQSQDLEFIFLKI